MQSKSLQFREKGRHEGTQLKAAYSKMPYFYLMYWMELLNKMATLPPFSTLPSLQIVSDGFIVFLFVIKVFIHLNIYKQTAHTDSIITLSYKIPKDL